MKFLNVLIVLFILGSLTACQRVQIIRSEKKTVFNFDKKLLLGSWSVFSREENFQKRVYQKKIVRILYNFYKDSSFSFQRFEGSENVLSLQGKWELKENMLRLIFSNGKDVSVDGFYLKKLSSDEMFLESIPDRKVKWIYKKSN